MKSDNHKLAGLLVKVFLCLASSTIVILLLFLATKKIQQSSFTRLFPPHVLLERKTLDLKMNSFYLSGVTDTHIFLSNSTAPAFLLSMPYSLSDSMHLKLTFPDSVKKLPAPYTCSIDSPFIYMVLGEKQSIFRGLFNQGQLQETKIKGSPFDSGIPVSQGSLIARIYDSSRKQNVLIKLMIDKSRDNFNVFVPDKQADGIFSIDGIVTHQRGNENFVFTYFYQNQFICLDSNLHIRYRARTIDTNRVAKISIASVSYPGKTTTTFSSPPLLVNRTAWSDDKYVYINSGIISKNEKKATYDNNSVIDVYYLATGAYKFSFYVPNENGQKPVAFRILHKKMVVLFNHTICTYRINF